MNLAPIVIKLREINDKSSLQGCQELRELSDDHVTMPWCIIISFMLVIGTFGLHSCHNLTSFDYND